VLFAVTHKPAKPHVNTGPNSPNDTNEQEPDSSSGGKYICNYEILLLNLSVNSVHFDLIVYRSYRSLTSCSS
jgi:hypothetical protein